MTFGHVQEGSRFNKPSVATKRPHPALRATLPFQGRHCCHAAATIPVPFSQGPAGPIDGGLPTRSRWKQSTGLFSETLEPLKNVHWTFSGRSMSLFPYIPNPYFIFPFFFI